MSEVNTLIKRLRACPVGTPGWSEFERVCTDILTYLFAPPLKNPKLQARTFSGIERMDAIFPNRNYDGLDNWAIFYRELDAQLVLFEFKNYDCSEIGKDEIIQTASYMKPTMGRLAFMVCSKKPDTAAHVKRNSVYTHHEKRVILFITKEDLEDMLYAKERGEDPSDFLVDLWDTFRIEHE